MKILNMRIKKQLVILKTVQNNQINSMQFLNGLLMLKKVLNKQVEILRILMQKQVFILKHQFMFQEMTEATKGRLGISLQWIQMSQILMKAIRRHGEKSTRQLMNRMLDKLNYFLNSSFNTVKVIQTRHKIFHLRIKVKM